MPTTLTLSEAYRHLRPLEPLSPIHPESLDWRSIPAPPPMLPVMAFALWRDGAWSPVQIVLADEIPMNPLCNHYGQAGFDGQSWRSGPTPRTVVTLRPRTHYERFSRTTTRYGMPPPPAFEEVDEAMWAGIIQNAQRGFAPPEYGVNYFRQFQQAWWATRSGVRTAVEYLYMQVHWPMTLPVFVPGALYITTTRSRAMPNWVGDVKGVAGYGPTLAFRHNIIEERYVRAVPPVKEVLYTELDHHTLCETGTSFLLYFGTDGKLIVPPQRDTFLPSTTAEYVRWIHGTRLDRPSMMADVTLDWIQDGLIALIATCGNIGGVKPITHVYIEGQHEDTPLRLSGADPDSPAFRAARDIHEKLELLRGGRLNAPDGWVHSREY